ncbi:MAG: hypothetical protein U9N73_04435, partial [Candidatus Auribacterota bacterium]|nr:hypothetical protein [Candidatus Auribacterota bacterium]
QKDQDCYLLKEIKMTLEQWVHNSWLKRHHVSREEITNLFCIIDRDLKDASEIDLSPDYASARSQ